MEKEKHRQTAYDGDDYRILYPEGFEKFFWNRFRAWKIGRLVRRFASGRILDIGCGCGHIVKFLRERGFDAEGCELSPAARPCSPEVAPFFYAGTDAGALPAAKREEFRTLLLLDVLEHIGEPEAFLENLLEKFVNCRCILITVPAFMKLWNPYADRGHCRRYTRESLAESLGQLPRLKTVRSGYFFHALYPAKLLCKGSEKRNRVEPVSGPAARAVNALAYAFFRVEDLLLPGSVGGSSLYAVIRVKRK